MARLADVLILNFSAQAANQILVAARNKAEVWEKEGQDKLLRGISAGTLHVQSSPRSSSMGLPSPTATPEPLR